MNTVNNKINLLEYAGLKLEKLTDVNAKSMFVVAIEKGGNYPEHSSTTDAILVVLEGNVVFNINNAGYDLTKNQMFSFKKDIPHSLNAKENSKLLLIK